MRDDGECGAVGGMRIGKGNQITRSEPAPMPICAPQIPHDLTWDRSRAAAVEVAVTNCLNYGTVLRQMVNEQ
jgi:hypothetical protein